MKIRPIKPRHSQGFTLMEMMLVLLIIALIIGAVAMNMSAFTGSASVTTTRAKVNSIESALMAFRMDNITTPTQAQGLEALVTKPGDAKRWRQYVKPEGILDAWGRKMIYKNPGVHNPSSYDIYSIGEDGLDGTADDIGNW
jgi:general secretion pathway protein G